jgi:hypothetical protein
MHGFMSSTLRVLWGGWLALVACGLSSCVPEYRPPSLSEPHAVVKVRLAYHDWSGPQIEQVVMLGEYGVKDFPVPVQGGAGVVIRPVLVRPGPAFWTVRTSFFHSYTTTRTESRGHVVNQTVWVNDAVCELAIRHLAIPNGLYILQYDYFANQRCSLHCLQQVQQPDGTLGHVPCKPAPPPS